MSYHDFTTTIKSAIARMSNLGGKFCFDLAVKVGVFRGRTVVVRQFESQIVPKQLGGGDGYNRCNFGNIRSGCRRSYWKITSVKFEGIQKEEDKNWFIIKYSAVLNDIIPEEAKYLRMVALGEACKLYEEAIELDKTKEGAMKYVNDSNILKKYSSKAKIINRFIIKFNAKLNKVIPEDVKYLREEAKYLRKEALEEACEIFEYAVAQEKTRKSAMKDVNDANILIKYSNIAEEVKRINWFIVKFNIELNKTIPDDMKYLRKDALEDACEIFKKAIAQEKTKEEAMQDVKDSGILKEYASKVDDRCVEEADIESYQEEIELSPKLKAYFKMRGEAREPSGTDS